jgi:RNA polymerase sigma-70 factor, ECF subfamily
VKVRLHRARLALRELLAEEVGQSAPQAFTFLAPRCNRVVAAVLSAIGGSPGTAS